MSFQNYENFPSQQGGQDGGAGPGAPPQQDNQMGGQMPGSAGGQYEGGNGAQPGSAGGQSQEGDAKTTLWCVTFSWSIGSLHAALVFLAGSRKHFPPLGGDMRCSS